MGKHLPARRGAEFDLLGIDRDDNALRADFVRRIGDQLGILHRGGVDADFICTGVEQAANIVDAANAAADCERNKHLRSNGFDDRQNQAALVGTGGDVQKRQFVGAFAVVAPRDFDRVAGVAQFEKINALNDAAGADVEAGDDALSEHVET